MHGVVLSPDSCIPNLFISYRPHNTSDAKGEAARRGPEG